MMNMKDILWDKILLMIGLHIIAIIGFKNFLQYSQTKTIAWFSLINVLSLLGTTCGAHRLWSHKAYKVNMKNF